MQSKPLISIIIPTRNRATLLKQAIVSTLDQEGVDDIYRMELIVVDDASTDETPDVARQYPTVKYLRLNKSVGGAACRNAGIKESRGEYIAFLDDDDLMLPYRLAYHLPVLEADPEIGVVYGQLIVKHQNHVSIWPEPSNTPSGFVFSRMLLSPFTSTATVLVRRNALDLSGWFDESLPVCQDFDLMLRLSLICSFKFRPGPVAIYRLSDDGLFLRHLSAGHYEEHLCRLIEKALYLLGQSEYLSQEKFREPACYVKFQMAQRWIGRRHPSVVINYILQSLKKDPFFAKELSRYPFIVKMLVDAAMATNGPVSALREFSKELSDVLIDFPWTARLSARRFIAEAWRCLVLEINDNKTGSSPISVAYAAFRAIIGNPTLCSWTLLKIIIAHFLPAFRRQLRVLGY